MTMEDADFMLELKNYPETREFAIVSHDEIKKEDHYKWLEKNIIWFKIIENQEQPIGAIRIFGAEISIWIDRKFWGLGLAEKAIRMVMEPGMYAKIVNGNVASFKTFMRAGFLPVGYKDGHYILMR